MTVGPYAVEQDVVNGVPQWYQDHNGNWHPSWHYVKDVYWVEADRDGNIRYYKRGNSKYPSYGKLKDGTWVEYGRSGKPNGEKFCWEERDGVTYVYTVVNGKGEARESTQKWPNSGRHPGGKERG